MLADVPTGFTNRKLGRIFRSYVSQRFKLLFWATVKLLSTRTYQDTTAVIMSYKRG